MFIGSQIQCAVTESKGHYLAYDKKVKPAQMIAWISNASSLRGNAEML